MIKIGSIKQRNRLLQLLLAAVVVPGVIISIIGVAAISRQKRAKELKLEEEYRNILIQARNEIETKIERSIRDTFVQISRKKITLDQPASLQEALKEILLKNPIVTFPFLIDSKGKFIFPFEKKADAPFFEMPKTDLYKGSAGAFFREGEDMEFRERRFIDAIKCYLKAQRVTRDEHIIPYIYNSIARCYYKLNKFPQAAGYLEDLQTDFMEQLKKNPSLHFSVLYQTALSYKAMKSKEDAVKTFLRLYDEILQYETFGDMGKFHFFKNEALDYMNRHIKEIDRESKELYRADVLDRLRNLSEIDISLNWSFFDIGQPVNDLQEEGAEISSEAFRLQKIREFYLANDEKSQFYRQVKTLPEWKRAAIPYFGLKKIGESWIAFDKVFITDRGKGSLFFGFLISPGFIANRIFPAVVKKWVNLAVLELSILDKEIASRGNGPAWELLSVPFRKYLTDKKLVLSSRDNGYFERIVKKELLLNYALIFALILALIFGIFFFYKFISREAGLVQVKSDFVDSASHTLKTPLTRIRMLAEKMELGWVDDDSKKQEYYQSIIAETDRMTEMINNMLDFSKVEAGKKVYEPQKLAIRDVVEPIITRFAKHMKGLRFQLDVDIAEDLPNFYFDPEAVRLMIVNLLQNAVKYSLQQKHVGINIYRDEDRVAIEVADKGIGLEQKEVEKIFTKFYRVGNEQVKALEGSGLGLFLVNHAVKAHNGEIKVRSKPGKGSTFTILLPL